jgi:signal peptidase II
LKKYLRDYLILFSIAGFIIILDQLTKFWIRDNLSLGQIYRSDLWTTAYFRIIHWKNTGAAFGMFQSGGTIFMILSTLVSLVIIYYFPQVPREEWAMRLAMAMLLGGAVGNLIDRFNQGYVTDFISVGNFPVFNVADASISIGVAILFISMWVQERAKVREEHEQALRQPEALAQDSPDTVDPETSKEPVEVGLSEEPPQK